MEQKTISIDYKYNVLKFANIPLELKSNIESAIGVQNIIDGKVLALEGNKLKHEFINHGNAKSESHRGQIEYAPKEIMDIVVTMLAPDQIELISMGDNLDERVTFVVAKKIDGVYVVVEAIGGRYNPTIVPTQVLRFTEEKWNEIKNDGLVLKEVIYINTRKNKRAITDEEKKDIIKNRVIVASYESNDSFSHTPKTLPHSPLFDLNISNRNADVNSLNSEKVTPTDYLNQSSRIESENQQFKADGSNLLTYISNIANKGEIYVRDFVEDASTNEDMFKVMKNVLEDMQIEKYEAGDIAQEIIINMGYDGITDIGGGRYNKNETISQRAYIAFAQEQIKSISNKKPTMNPDIRYSSKYDTYQLNSKEIKSRVDAEDIADKLASNQLVYTFDELVAVSTKKALFYLGEINLIQQLML